MAGLLPILGQTCRDARTRASVEQLEIAVRAGITQSSVSRFEHGLFWPRNPEVLIDAYAAELGVPALTLWMRALAEWATGAMDES